MIRLKQLLSEGVYVNERTIPLDDTVDAGFPCIWWKYGNPYHIVDELPTDNHGVTEIWPLTLIIKKDLNSKFQNLFGVSITKATWNPEKSYYPRMTLYLSGGSNNYYYEEWDFGHLQNFGKSGYDTEDTILPKHWQLHLAGKTSGGQSSEIIIKSATSQRVNIGHFTQVIRGYDRDYEYEKHADGYGETNYYARPKGGSLTRLKPGSEAYMAVKTKVFRDT